MNRRKNVRLIKQKTPSDCGICSIAMLTGVGYKKAYEACVKCKAYVEGEGMYNAKAGLLELGLKEGKVWHPVVKSSYRVKPIDFKEIWHPYEISPRFWREQIWGRRALLSLPSLNNKGGSHMIYWHYDRIYDPSPKKTYKDFNELEPKVMILFMEKT